MRGQVEQASQTEDRLTVTSINNIVLVIGGNAYTIEEQQ